MPSAFGTWLSGAPLPEPADRSATTGGFPGSRLGLPRDGTGSLAGSGRRFVALLIDWLVGYGVAALGVTLGWYGISALSTAILVVWLLVGATAVRLFGFTPGQLALGIRVASVDNRMHVGAGRALARGVLVALVVPPLFTDGDGRGLHDRATATAVVRR